MDDQHDFIVFFSKVGTIVEYRSVYAVIDLGTADYPHYPFLMKMARYNSRWYCESDDSLLKIEVNEVSFADAYNSFRTEFDRQAAQALKDIEALLERFPAVDSPVVWLSKIGTIVSYTPKSFSVEVSILNKPLYFECISQEDTTSVYSFLGKQVSCSCPRLALSSFLMTACTRLQTLRVEGP